MKRITTITLTLLLLAINGYSQRLPNVEVKEHNGKELNTENLIDGKTPFIILFWSTICKPCINELDAIYDNIEDWQELANFRVVAVSTDDSRSAFRAKSMASSRGWGDYFKLLYDVNQNFKRALNVNVIPQVFIFDKNGKMIYSHTGYIPGAETEYIKKIVELEKKRKSEKKKNIK